MSLFVSQKWMQDPLASGSRSPCRGLHWDNDRLLYIIPYITIDTLTLNRCVFDVCCHAKLKTICVINCTFKLCPPPSVAGLVCSNLQQWVLLSLSERCLGIHSQLMGMRCEIPFTQHVFTLTCKHKCCFCIMNSPLCRAAYKWHRVLWHH